MDEHIDGGRSPRRIPRSTSRRGRLVALVAGVAVSTLIAGACGSGARDTASNSSSFEAGFVARRSSTGCTRPRPKKFAQTRLQMARAKSGFSGDVSQRARYSRRSSRLCDDMGVPSSGVGASTWPLRGWRMSPSAVDTTIDVSLLPDNVSSLIVTRAKRLANA